MTALPPPLRLGVIGAGFMGRRHADFIDANPQTVLAAVADPFTTDLARERDVPHFVDHGELLQSGLVDAVVIANPNAAHVPAGLDCLAAGIPALLEKPVATSLAEAAELCRGQARSSTPILVGHHRRHHPAAAAARNLIADGGLGRLVAVNGMWLTKKADSYFDAEWRRRKGAGVLLINLVHDLDLLRFMCGEITSVQAKVSSSIRGLEVDDTASLILQFEDGALGSFVISDSAAAPWTWDQATEDDPTFPYHPGINCYSLAGTEGALAFPGLVHYRYPGAADWNHAMDVRYLYRNSSDSYTNQLMHFVDVVRGEAAPQVTVDDAARTLALIEAAQQASETGRAVDPAGLLPAGTP